MGAVDAIIWARVECGELADIKLEGPMSTVEQKSYTPEDLLEMPDGDRYELVRGQLVEKDMTARAGWVSGQVLRLMGNFVDANQLGWGFSDGTGVQCFSVDPSMVRRPDGCYVARGRFPDEIIPEGHIRIPPDLAVEVVSPNDASYDVERKVGEYLDAGVRQVWVINPNNHTVKVYRSEGDVWQLDEDAELSGGDVLPGFRCAVHTLFPPTVRTTDSQ